MLHAEESTNYVISILIKYVNCYIFFSHEEAMWPEIEQGMRLSFHFLYELAEPHNDTDEAGQCAADLGADPSSAANQRNLILSLVLVIFCYALNQSK